MEKSTFDQWRIIFPHITISNQIINIIIDLKLLMNIKKEIQIKMKLQSTGFTIVIKKYVEIV